MENFFATPACRLAAAYSVGKLHLWRVKHNWRNQGRIKFRKLRGVRIVGERFEAIALFCSRVANSGPLGRTRHVFDRPPPPAPCPKMREGGVRCANMGENLGQRTEISPSPFMGVGVWGGGLTKCRVVSRYLRGNEGETRGGGLVACGRLTESPLAASCSKRWLAGLPLSKGRRVGKLPRRFNIDKLSRRKKR